MDATLEEMEKNAGILYERNVVGAYLRIFREKGVSPGHIQGI